MRRRRGVTLNSVSKAIYRAGRISRDARAVQRSVQTGSPAPLARRYARKVAWRGFSRLMRRSGL